MVCVESVSSVIDSKQVTNQQIKIPRVIFVWRFQDFEKVSMNILVVGIEISNIERRVVLFLIEVVAKHVKPNMVSSEYNSIWNASVVSITFKLM